MINLGDRVKDMVTGFTGIAVHRYEYLSGCARISVQPPVKETDSEYKLPDALVFDEPQLVLVEAGVVKPFQPALNPPGGPKDTKSINRP